ncbi:spore germination protein [Paenibacillus sp. Leaf72]|uniref:spore germination protein n=1 Tax=Paenibacillus sp. Leaf72 TaxID=1736234 RepID=UPI0009D705B8|nr:spore germination protein [Paenibacillus sp. Leaf72]
MFFNHTKSGGLNQPKGGSPRKKHKEQPFSPSLKSNIDTFTKLLGHSSDLEIKPFASDLAPEITMSLVYLSEMVNEATLNESVLRPLMEEDKQAEERSNALIHLIKEQIIQVGSTYCTDSIEEAIDMLLNGYCLLLVQEASSGLMINVSSKEGRTVSEPTTQTVLRGPQQSFNEILSTNINLMRQIIKSPDLHIESMVVGSQTRTQIAMLYLNGVASAEAVKTIRERLEAIEVSGILESGYIEALIQEKRYTPFPTLMNTERPDAVAGGILEGQIAIVVDGTPFVLLAPVTLFQFFQTPEDYYHRFDIATFLRLIRFVSFLISMLLPALYIAVTTFHQEMLPTTLLITLAAQREGIPFPGLVEALIMEMTFEVLREAGVRMPRAIGPAISIVGALVLGQAAVDAGIVSAGMVMVVSFTAISSFVIPQFNIAISARLIRFTFMLLAGVFGFMGIVAGFMAMLIHLAGLESFGVPYMTPLAPFNWSAMKDTFIRAPHKALLKREATNKINRTSKAE